MLNEELNFSEDHPIQATHRINQEGEAIIYWTDGVNPPRFYNIDKDEGFTRVEDLNIFPDIEHVTNIDLLEVNDYGGSLTSGAYQFAVRYVDPDGNTSNFLSSTRPISIVRQVPKINDNGDRFSEGNPTLPTGKSITLKLSNIDQLYDRFEIAVLRYEGLSLQEVTLLQPITINDEEMEFTYTGGESMITGSIEEINIPRGYYEKAGNITQQDDVLYLGNLEGVKQPEYQPYANNIKAEVVSRVITSDEHLEWNHGDETLVYFNKSFRREEPYAFYIGFRMKDGSRSMAYHIPGREAEAGERDTVSILSGNPNEQNAAAIDNTAKKFHFFSTAGDNGMAYWENENEVYPDSNNSIVLNIDENGNDEQVGDLSGQPVRHHKFPSYNDQPLVGTYSSGHNIPIRTLGIRFKNIKIPQHIIDQIRSVEIYYAKKDFNNRVQLDQGIPVGNLVESNRWKLQLSTRNQDKTDDYQAFSMHPFSTLLRNTSVAQVSYVKKHTRNIVNKVDTPGLIFLNPDRFFSLTMLEQEALGDSDAGYILPIDAISIVPPHTETVQITQLGFSRNKSTNREVSAVFYELSGTTNYDYNATLGGYYSGNSSLVSLKKELFAPFDQQVLIPTGTVITDLDRFSHDIEEGDLATGSVTIEEDAPTETEEFFEVEVSGTANDAFTLKMSHNGFDDTDIDDISIANGDQSFDIVDKIVTRVNGDGDLSYTAQNISGAASPTTLRITSKQAGTLQQDSILFSKDSQSGFGTTFGVSIDNEQPEFDGSVVLGSIVFEIGEGENVFSHSLSSEETKLSIANALSNSLNSGSFDYTSTVDDSGADPVINITSVMSGEVFNKTISNITNDNDINHTIVNMSGGTGSISNFFDDVFSGDTFINKYGRRVTRGTSENVAKHVYFSIVESYDNIYFRESGEGFGDINGNDFNKFNILVGAEEYADNQGIDTGGISWHDNFFSYDDAHSLQGSQLSTTPYPKRFDEISRFPTRVIRSQTESNLSSVDNFRIFLADDFLDLPRNRGEIRNLEVLNNILLVHMQRGLYRTKGREELVTGDFRAFLGNGNIFQVKPDELYNTEDGFAGIQDFRSSNISEAGYFFIDQQKKSAYLFSDGIQEISSFGMRNFFDNSLDWKINSLPDVKQKDIREIKIITTFDPEYNRILLTKIDYEPTNQFFTEIDSGTITFDSDINFYKTGGQKINLTNETYFTDVSFTISYLPEIDKWVSFHSYKPDYYLRDTNYFYSLNNDKLYIHKGFPLLFYGDIFSFEFEFVDNRSPDVTKLLQNVEFISYSYNLDGSIDYKTTFDKLRVSNELQDSDEIDMVYFTEPGGNLRNTEHTWKVNKIRDLINPDTREIDHDLPFYRKKKFTGKYAKIRLYYTPKHPKELRLISAEVSFRESHR